MTNSTCDFGEYHVDIEHQLKSLHFCFQESMFTFTLALALSMGIILFVPKTFVSKIKF
jgi:hypothetical protein